jgi:hypothetical protein
VCATVPAVVVDDEESYRDRSPSADEAPWSEPKVYYKIESCPVSFFGLGDDMHVCTKHQLKNARLASFHSAARCKQHAFMHIMRKGAHSDIRDTFTQDDVANMINDSLIVKKQMCCPSDRKYYGEKAAAAGKRKHQAQSRATMPTLLLLKIVLMLGRPLFFISDKFNLKFAI